MKQLSLRNGFMLFLVIMLFAWQNRVWALGESHNVQGQDGCAWRGGNTGGGYSSDEVKLSQVKDPITLYYPVANVNENIQMGERDDYPAYLITPSTGNTVMEQNLQKLRVYCQLAGDKKGGSPYLQANITNNINVNNTLRNRGLVMQYKLPDTDWRDIDDRNNITKLNDLVYKEYLNIPVIEGGINYKRVNYTTFSGSTYAKAFSLSLRLLVTDITKLSNNNNDSAIAGIPLGVLFYVMPKSTDDGSQKAVIQSIGNLKFAVARCKPAVAIIPEQVDFGTLTAYKLNQSVVAERPFRIRVSKNNACADEFTVSSKYSVPNLRVMFTPIPPTLHRDSAPLMGNDGEAFPGLSFSIRRDGAYASTGVNFESPVFLAPVQNQSFIGLYDQYKEGTFWIKIKKDTTYGETIGTGQFHASATVQVTFN